MPGKATDMRASAMFFVQAPDVAWLCSSVCCVRMSSLACNWQVAESAPIIAKFVHAASQIYSRSTVGCICSGARVTDVPYIYTYIYTRAAICTVYVGLAQARPNKC